MESSKIFCGSGNFTMSELTVGKLFLNALKTKDPLEVIVVDHNTGEQITSGRMLQDSIKIAMALQNLGITKGDVISIISKNSWKYIVSLLSALYVGCTVGNLNSKCSKDDLLHQLTIIKPKLLFVSEDVIDTIKSSRKDLPFVQHIVTFGDTAQNGEILFNDLCSGYVNCEDFEVQDNGVEECIILYSSGTTGLPKAVILTQNNVKAGVALIVDPQRISIQNDTILVVLPMFHMYGLYLSLGCLLYGKRNIILDKFKPETLLQCIEKYKVSFLPVVPPLVLFLAKSPLVEQYDLSSIKVIICGAAPLRKEVEVAVLQRLGVRVHQIFGSTETGVVMASPANGQRYESCGKILPGCRLKIVDPENGKSLGKNLTGELCIKSPAVMKGYKDNEEATRTCMDDEGFVHAGDLGYIDDDDYLYIVGRTKDIIKYKGFQVSPVQIESILLKHPEIMDTAVIGRPDERAGELPTAVVVRQPKSKVTEQDIMDYVAERVSPEKRLSGGVLFVNEIPKSRIGKILRNELKKFL